MVTYKTQYNILQLIQAPCLSYGQITCVRVRLMLYDQTTFHMEDSKQSLLISGRLGLLISCWLIILPNNAREPGKPSSHIVSNDSGIAWSRLQSLQADSNCYLSIPFQQFCMMQTIDRGVVLLKNPHACLAMVQKENLDINETASQFLKITFCCLSL